jgi:hypothetical protein
MFLLLSYHLRNLWNPRVAEDGPAAPDERLSRPA